MELSVAAGFRGAGKSRDPLTLRFLQRLRVSMNFYSAPRQQQQLPPICKSNARSDFMTLFRSETATAYANIFIALFYYDIMNIAA
jgi:hypothetical protein